MYRPSPTLFPFMGALLLLALAGCVPKDTAPADSTTPLPLAEAPQALSAQASDATISLSFQAPSNATAAAISSYLATCSNGASSVQASAGSSPIVVSGLSNGTTYSCVVQAQNASGSGTASASALATPQSGTTSGAAFTLGSSIVAEGGSLPSDYTCDGMGSSLALTWSNVPTGTQSFALLMTTLPGDGTTKWNWVLYNLPAALRTLPRDSLGLGTLGVGSDGPIRAYQPPCSQGPGAKRYTYTLYALSGTPSLSVPESQVSGSILTQAIAPLILGSASLNVYYTRNQLGSSNPCLLVRNSVQSAGTGNASVSCDATYAYISSDGIAPHTMMNGITATNLQVPTPQNFQGSNAWRIPLAPALASTTVSAADGPVGMAVNGVPLFNPCKQGGCQFGDTKVLGELDVCNGHAGRADDYHYHAAPVCLMATKPAAYWDTHPLGWALDGFAIFGYHDADGSTAVRDGICGGNTLSNANAPAGYSYHVTDASPYILSCFRGTPSPDLAGQAAKFHPMRQPPVTPFGVSNMTHSTDPADGYQVVQFTSAQSFTTTETGADSYSNGPGTYQIRYLQLSGAALMTALAQPGRTGKTACWAFQFKTAAGTNSQPDTTYCK